MIGSIDVPLSRRYEIHGVTFEKLTLVEPKADSYFRLGEIETWQPGARGAALRIVFDDVVIEYLRECVKSPGEGASGLDAMSELGLQDARKLRESFIDFFGGRTTEKAAS